MPENNVTPDSNASLPTLQTKNSSRQWFVAPKPIKQLFDKFPLQTLPSNELPQRTARKRTQHTLYMFTTEDGALRNAPSFNPSCLKWQTYLKFTSLDFRTAPSTNHASPTGSLPFLLPFTPSASSPLPIPSTKLEKWTRDNKLDESGPPSLKYEAYKSLLDHRIRNAWLYTLYLTPSNFSSIARPLYILPCSSNTLVHAAIAHQLKQAAEAELLKQSTVIDMEALYKESEKAFFALSSLLGDDVYFFHADKPGLFDASVFAYTHLLLDEALAWQETRLVNILKKQGNLVRHQQRILQTYFDGMGV